MKKTALSFLLILIFIFASACANENAGSGAAVSPSPTPTDGFSGVPGGPSAPVPSEPASTQPPKKSDLYDPSIFVIQASGEYRMELAPGYFADYSCDIYLHKIDANDNRAVAGAYQGYFWMDVKLDADEFIDDMLKDVPFELDFAGAGEAMSDNFGIYLSAQDDKAWVNYSISGEDGKPLPLTRDTPVARGAFEVVTRDVYLKAKGSGAQGVKVDFSQIAEDDLTDMNYVVHVQPDSMEQGTQREVIFQISDANGVSFIVKGTLTRLPGYPEDVSDYLNSKGYNDAVSKHFGE
ncbi:MAG: hypothetical protein AAGU74_10760 [Bacillota bacterium]